MRSILTLAVGFGLIAGTAFAQSPDAPLKGRDTDPALPARWSLVGSAAGITEWLNLEPSTGEAVLVGLIGADQALSLQSLSDDELLVVAQSALTPFAVAAG